LRPLGCGGASHGICGRHLQPYPLECSRVTWGDLVTLPIHLGPCLSLMCGYYENVTMLLAADALGEVQRIVLCSSVLVVIQHIQAAAAQLCS
jgi:hypothetical protein